MDFGKLSQVTDSLSNPDKSKKKDYPKVEGRTVVKDVNPFGSSKTTKRPIADAVNSRVIVVDSLFIKRLKEVTREQRRKFLSRLTDSQRKRVLNMMKIGDDDKSKLEFITLDTLLANYVYDPSEVNKANITDFLDTTSLSITDGLKTLVDEVLDGKETLSDEGLQELNEGLDGVNSRLEAFSGEEVKVDEETDLTEEEVTSLEDSAKKHVEELFADKDFAAIQDKAEVLLADMQLKNKRYGDSAKIYWDTFKKYFNTQFNQKTKEIEDSIGILSEIVDDKVLDKNFEGPAFKGNTPVKNVEDRSVLELLVEALDDYENSPEKLEAILKMTISGDETEESDLTEDDDNSVDTTEDTPDEIDEKDENQVKDAVHKLVAKILKGKNVNKLADALTKICPSLSRFNLRVEDCAVCVTAPTCEGVTAVDIPLSCAEYHQLFGGIPTTVAGTLAEKKSPVWPFVQYSIKDGVITAGGRQYMPYAETLEEIERRLNEAESDEDRRKIIGSTCVPLRDYQKVAAQYDSLHLLDSRFYRPSTASKSWKFDGDIKEFLGDSFEGSQIQRCMEPEATLHIQGYPYKVV